MGTPACDKEKITAWNIFHLASSFLFWRFFQIFSLSCNSMSHPRKDLFFYFDSFVKLKTTFGQALLESCLKIRPQCFFFSQPTNWPRHARTNWHHISDYFLFQVPRLSDLLFYVLVRFSSPFFVTPALLTLKCEFQICMKQKKTNYAISHIDYYNI